MTGTKGINQKHEGAQLSSLIPFDSRTTLRLLLREGDQELRPSSAKGIKSNQVESLRDEWGGGQRLEPASDYDPNTLHAEIFNSTANI